jgi:hypothetical protein
MTNSVIAFVAAVHRLVVALGRFVSLPPLAQQASRASADGADASLAQDEAGVP